MQITITQNDQHKLVSILSRAIDDTLVAELITSLSKTEEDNVILDLSEVREMSNDAAEKLNLFVSGWKEKQLSLLGFGVEESYLSPNSFEFEITPTLSEAQDIVFMEIVERELNSEL